MIKMKRWRALGALAATVALAGTLGLLGCSSGEAEQAKEPEQPTASEATEQIQLQVFAANSLEKALDEVQALYTEKTGVTFADTQYLSSGELVEKMKGGAPADLLITASKGTMDDAVESALVDGNTRFDMFTNDLVMVTSENSDVPEGLTLGDIATGEYKVCVGDDSVPAGNYACQALSTVGCYNDPDGKTGKDSTGKGGTFDGTPLEGVLLDSSVGNVCKHAESGEVDVAFVYSSDVARFGGVKIVGTVPADTHKAIVYPAAVSAGTEHAEAVQAFLDWATTDEEALRIWQEWAFDLVAE